jgi:polyhydroxyalkanoate synthesis regulator phasin
MHKIIIISLLVLSINTHSEDQNSEQPLEKYESGQNKGYGKIYRLNRVDSQVSGLTSELQALKAKIQSLEKRITALENSKK